MLDRQRLGKQRVETYQVMKVLCGLTIGGWQNHPAVRMWRGYEAKLLEYQSAVCFEWHEVRGYKDTCFAKTDQVWCEAGQPGFDYERLIGDDRVVASFRTVSRPPWLGNEELHESHRSNLVRKSPLHYVAEFDRLGASYDATQDYVWPVA